jgi:3'-5' exoribonuclease
VSQKIGIKSLPIGKQFTGFCVVRKKEMRYKGNGEAYLHLELGDWSGRLNAKLWDDIAKFNKMIEVGKIIKIKAMVQKFQDHKELKISNLRKAKPEDDVDLKQLLPKSNKDISALRNHFFEHVGGIQNSHLKRLLSAIFSDGEFADRFFLSPAGKLWHHNYLYGMLEHVAAMLDIAVAIQSHYPEVNIDLLKCGIILHDIGKMTGYDVNGFVDFTDEGRLIGHITIGYDMIRKKIDDIKDFPTELRDQLLHMLLSHQGKLEQGSPVVPSTIEAIILHNINELDSKTNALWRIVENDILPGSKWSKFIPVLDRFIYHNKTDGPERNK